MAIADPVEASTFYDNVKEYNFTNCSNSLLIVGPCRAGKSAFCNFLLKEKRFTEAIGLLASTEKTDYCRIPGKDGDMLVVDCPGFCYSKRPPDEIIEELCKAAILCREGMEAIGIVIDPTSRFNETQKISYEMIDSVGGNFWKHAFIIFNHEKKLEKNFGNANEYIKQITKDVKCPAEFKELLNKVDNRYICVESTKQCGDEVYWSKLRDNLLAMIMQIKENNTGAVYTNSFMKYGQTAYISLLELQDRKEVKNVHIPDEGKSTPIESRQLKELHGELAPYERTGHDLKDENMKQGCSVM